MFLVTNLSIDNIVTIVNESALAELEVYLKDMDEPYDGYFTRHKVMNERMREVLVYTMKHSETAEFKYKK